LLTPLLVQMRLWLFTTSELLGHTMTRIDERKPDRFPLASAYINRPGA
jgi:hypothetical protein